MRNAVAENFATMSPHTLKGSSVFDDAELCAAISRKEEWALAALYDRYVTVLYSLAFNILADEQRAQEVVQEIFLHAWDHPSPLPERHLDVWLIFLCRNLAIARRGAPQPLKKRAQEWQGVMELLLGQENGAPQSERAQRDGRVLQQFVAGLPAPQKQVVEMSYLRGMSAAEIGTLIGVPETSIKRQTRQMQAQLYTCLLRSNTF